MRIADLWWHCSFCNKPHFGGWRHKWAHLCNTDVTHVINSTADTVCAYAIFYLLMFNDTCYKLPQLFDLNILSKCVVIWENLGLRRSKQCFSYMIRFVVMCTCKHTEMEQDISPIQLENLKYYFMTNTFCVLYSPSNHVVTRWEKLLPFYLFVWIRKYTWAKLHKTLRLIKG